MPVTTIDEYGHLGSSEQHVSSTAQADDGQRSVHLVPETTGVNKTPNGELRAGACAPLPLHAPQGGRTTCFGHGADQLVTLTWSAISSRN